MRPWTWIAMGLAAFGFQTAVQAQTTAESSPRNRASADDYFERIRLERERIRKVQESRNYPKGQRGVIVSDDIEAVKREQALTTRVVAAGANGARASVDEAKLNAQVQRQIDAAKLDKQIRDLKTAQNQQQVSITVIDKQIRDLNTKVQDARQELYRLKKERAEIASKEGQPDSLTASFLSSARNSFRDATADLDRVQDKWQNRRNTSCSDGLTYEACQCRNGAFSKRLVHSQLVSAETRYESAQERFETQQEKYEESKARNKKLELDKRDRELATVGERLDGDGKRLKDLQARREALSAQEKADNDKRLKDLQVRREALSAQEKAAESSKPATPQGGSPRVTFIDEPKKAKPKSPPVLFEQFPR